MRRKTFLHLEKLKQDSKFPLSSQTREHCRTLRRTKRVGEWKDKDIGRGFEWERKIDRDKDSEKERVRRRTLLRKF